MIFALAGASMVQTYNLDMYARKQPEGPFSVSNKSSDVLKRMAESLFGLLIIDIEVLNDLKKEPFSFVHWATSLTKSEYKWNDSSTAKPFEKVFSRRKTWAATLSTSKKKCGICKSEIKFRRMTNYKCQNCYTPICLNHVNLLCGTCYSTAELEDSTSFFAHDSGEK